jgi:hypothetical protein
VGDGELPSHGRGQGLGVEQSRPHRADHSRAAWHRVHGRRYFTMMMMMMMMMIIIIIIIMIMMMMRMMMMMIIIIIINPILLFFVFYYLVVCLLLEKIAQTGFAVLSSLDAGFFGVW